MFILRSYVVGRRETGTLNPDDVAYVERVSFSRKLCIKIRRVLLYNIFWPRKTDISILINPLKAELNPVCHLLALLGGATIVVVSRLRVNIKNKCKVYHTNKNLSIKHFLLSCRRVVRIISNILQYIWQ